MSALALHNDIINTAKWDHHGSTVEQEGGGCSEWPAPLSVPAAHTLPPLLRHGPPPTVPALLPSPRASSCPAPRPSSPVPTHTLPQSSLLLLPSAQTPIPSSLRSPRTQPSSACRYKGGGEGEEGV